MKGKFNRLLFVLNILNSIEINEQEDKSVVISLNLKDFPDGMKKAVHERMKDDVVLIKPDHQHFFKEFYYMEDSDINMNIWVNKNKEIEKALLTIGGKQKGEPDEVHELNFKAELCFV